MDLLVVDIKRMVLLQQEHVFVAIQMQIIYAFQILVKFLALVLVVQSRDFLIRMLHLLAVQQQELYMVFLVCMLQIGLTQISMDVCVINQQCYQVEQFLQYVVFHILVELVVGM